MRELRERVVVPPTHTRLNPFLVDLVPIPQDPMGVDTRHEHDRTKITRNYSKVMFEAHRPVLRYTAQLHGCSHVEWMSNTRSLLAIEQLFRVFPA